MLAPVIEFTLDLRCSSLIILLAMRFRTPIGVLTKLAGEKCEPSSDKAICRYISSQSVGSALSICSAVSNSSSGVVCSALERSRVTFPPHRAKKYAPTPQIA